MDTTMTHEEALVALANAKTELENHLSRYTIANGVGTALEGLVEDSTITTSQASAVHTAIMSELDITADNPFTQWDIEVTFPDGDSLTVRVTASDEDTAIDSVRDDISIDDVSVRYSVTIDGQYSSVVDTDYSIDESDLIDSFEFNATEVSD